MSRTQSTLAGGRFGAGWLARPAAVLLSIAPGEVEQLRSGRDVARRSWWIGGSLLDRQPPDLVGQRSRERRQSRRHCRRQPLPKPELGAADPHEAATER